MAEPTITKVDLAGVEATHYEWPGVVRPDYETDATRATEYLQQAAPRMLHDIRENLRDLRPGPMHSVTTAGSARRILTIERALDAVRELEQGLTRVVG